MKIRLKTKIINLQAVIDSWDYRFAASLKVLHGCYWRTCNRKDCKAIGSPGIRKEREESEKDERALVSRQSQKEDY